MTKAEELQVARKNEHDLKEKLRFAEAKLKAAEMFAKAEELGFYVEGNTFISSFNDGGIERVIAPYIEGDTIRYNYFADSDELRSDGMWCENRKINLCSNPLIYKKGVWATIHITSELPQFTHEELEEKLGYKFIIS